MIARGTLPLALGVGLSLSVGWGIRGNFGHEIGAMIPGALAALAAVILSGRADWLERVGSFAFFGAVGWSFGGSISYMQVIAYTHSGHSLSVIYGFACLFLIGFLWAIFGGVGTALPAFATRAQLNALYPLVFAIFAGWCLQGFLAGRLIHVDPDFRHRDPLYWYDTDWLGISVALAVTLAWALVRRQFDFGASLVTHLCVGWWGGFAFFVLLLGWRMTPPRGDNWAGCLGMAVGLVVFLAGQRLHRLLYAGLVAGLWGGFGFAFADFLKLLGVDTGWTTNWHSVLEQSYGLINGLGIAAMMLAVRRVAGPVTEQPEGPASFWAERTGLWFVLAGITYLNLQKNVETWIRAKAVPAELYGMSAQGWFALAYVLAGLLIASVLFGRRERPWGLLGGSPLARAQLFYLVFLWWIVIGNFERALVGFAPQRLITEGVIQVNAILCTALILRAPGLAETLPAGQVSSVPWSKLAWRGLATLILATALPWASLRLLNGDQQIGYASRHIRFGPQATATREKPAADRPHP